MLYVNDVLHLTKYTQEDMLNINQVYPLKEGFKPPDKYLGANVNKVRLEYGRTVWSTICVEYMHGAIMNVDSII